MPTKVVAYLLSFYVLLQVYAAQGIEAFNDFCITFGLWLARYGGLHEPGYDKRLAGFAKQGVTSGERMGSPAELYLEAYKTVCLILRTQIGKESKELGFAISFAIAREIYARSQEPKI